MGSLSRAWREPIAPDVQPPQVSLIIPTLNEADNLPILADRIRSAMRGRTYEIIIVDDASRDGTQQVAGRLSAEHPMCLLVREHPTGGLGGAVIHGMEAARGEILVVMDADLQHPPEALPALLAPLESDEADFVIGSRHVSGASVDGQWSVFRRVNSAVATLLARPIAGRVSDPMSGFFSLRRQTFLAAQRLEPMGYKIGLELMCKCRVQRIREVPIQFGTRLGGSSKLSTKEQVRYVQHLASLYCFAFPRLSAVINPSAGPGAQPISARAISQTLRRAA